MESVVEADPRVEVITGGPRWTAWCPAIAMATV